MTNVATTSPTATYSTTTSEPEFGDCEHALGHDEGAKVVNIKLGNPIPCGSCNTIGDSAVHFGMNLHRAMKTYIKRHILLTIVYEKTCATGMETWLTPSTNISVLGDEASRYTLVVGSYSGTAGDSFHYPLSYQLQHHQVAFSTRDHDNDNSPANCARELRGGWWFNDCYSSNLNGVFIDHPFGARTIGESYPQHPLEGTGLEWCPYKRRQYSMRSVEMKITKSRVASILG
ncbi:fibrinogen C domain-containing protein 1-A-like [Dreissena polymorpha]|uniref:fibrinogen C domain-containing protein 1-A-like n=1 Tax=Dreissena polymorpha TaxID=45954 RepID=UPI0022643061|nr:fibrinogen C domain-containing protein 1-A-like [Dreissena polymorpha]